MILKVSDFKSIKPFIEKLSLPESKSHKGQNGKVLVIGGSSLFHSASIWSAEVASHFADMVHYSSSSENNEIFLAWKKKFRNGMVVSQKALLDYIREDDVMLLGPGMVRGAINPKTEILNPKFNEILKIENEAEYSYYLTKYLLSHYPEKKFVIDAGALQMLNPKWLIKMKTKTIITPHRKEFNRLFGISIDRFSVAEKIKIVKGQAKKYNCIILLKAVDDFISDGKSSYVISGGNAGLTKGGSGDVLAGLTASFYLKNSASVACILASILLKKTAEEIFAGQGYWYNIDNILEKIPAVLKSLTDKI